MKQFKKRTLALVLASTITVVGAFGAENYKNSLVSLRFEGGDSNAVKLTMLTKRQFKTGINTIKRDANTYVVVLPETNCEITEGYEFDDTVESVDVKTIPYTKSQKGYTTITVKTVKNVPFFAKTALFLTDNGTPLEPELPEETEEVKKVPEPPVKREPVKEPVKTSQRTNSIHSGSGVDQTSPVDIKQSVKQFQPNQPVEKEKVSANKNAKTVEELAKENELTPFKEKIYTALGVIFALLVMAFFWFKAKDQMAGLVGEDKYDVNDEPKKKKKSEEKKKPVINTTIKNLDKKYSKPVKMPVTSPQPAAEEIPEEKPETENVVDLDELLQQAQNSTAEPVNEEDEEENSALDDFLSSFSFDEESEEETSEESADNHNDLQAASVEVSDNVKKQNSEYMDSSEIESKPSPLELLEKTVLTYVTERNVMFTREDVDALYKLMNVEIDGDFVTDLRTNPELVREMQEEIEKQKSKSHKTSELLTLNVKDMLPDLSEALKKQGGRRIESEVKPQVVYYSEGYDVSTLKLNADLPDLSAEIDNEEAYKVRPSDEFQLVDNSYEVQKMEISGLPDLKDVMANPDKYETPEPEPEEVDEEALLNNIMNVTFKPFDDGTREFEVINEFNDEDAPTRSDIQEEFNQFDEGFEIVEEEELPEIEENEQDDFVSLYDNNYVDLDKDTSSEAVLEENNDVEPLDETPPAESDKLLLMIKDIENKRRAKNASVKNVVRHKQQQSAEEKPLPEFCIVEGEKFSVVSASYFADKIGCYLAKNENGYCIIGFTGDKTFKIKHYEKLNVEKLQSRMSEKLDDGTQRYIVRIGIHKFIMNVKPDDMQFVMDLC